jgi:hypothetical protein
MANIEKHRVKGTAKKSASREETKVEETFDCGCCGPVDMVDECGCTVNECGCMNACMCC